MNHSITTADRGTHFRIAAVAVVCAAVFLTLMVGYRGLGVKEQVARGDAPGIIKATPTITISTETSRVVR